MKDTNRDSSKNLWLRLHSPPLVCFLALALLFFVFEKRSRGDVIITNDHVYEYINEPVKNHSGETMFYHGKIFVKDKGGKVVYSERTNLQPEMCDDYPITSKLSFKLPQEAALGKEKEIVVFCGSIAGRHKTLKLFSRGPGGMRTTSIDFENTSPNLTKLNDEGLYASIVYRRLMFKNIGYKTIPYLFAYTIHDDSSIFGFKPAYGLEFNKYYMDYYQSLKERVNNENLNDYIGPLLASLISIREEGKICKEFVGFISGLSESIDTDGWMKRLVASGYPDFNFNVCQRSQK